MSDASVIQGPVRKLVIFRMPEGGMPISSEQLEELRRRTAEHLASGRDPSAVCLAPGWSIEVVEGDEVFVRIEAATDGGGGG